MKLYQAIIGTITLGGVIFGATQLYRNGIESGFESGIESGRAQMESAVLGNLNGRVRGINRDISFNRNTETPCDSTINALKTRKEECMRLKHQLYNTTDEFFIWMYTPLDNSKKE